MIDNSKLDSIIYENKDSLEHFLFPYSTATQGALNLFPYSRSKTSQNALHCFLSASFLFCFFLCCCLSYTRKNVLLFYGPRSLRTGIRLLLALMKIQFANCLCSKASVNGFGIDDEFPARFAHFENLPPRCWEEKLFFIFIRLFILRS